MSLDDFVRDNLSGSAPARHLRAHLQNFESRVNAPAADSARSRVRLLRQTLLHGLQNGKRCGLPDKLPRVVVLLDLSGEKALLTSDASTLLLSAVVTGFASHHDRARHLRELCTLEAWAEEQGLGLLGVAVLPWQAGVGNCAFEIRTFKQDGERVLDGQKLIAHHLIGVRDGSRTTNPPEAPVGAKEVRALADNVAAVSVDLVETPAAPEEEESKQVSGMQAIARRLASERNEMRLQMERQKENEEERVLQAVAKKEAIALEKHVQATKLRNTCEEKMKASEAAVQAAMAEKVAAEKATAEAKRALAEMSLHLKETETAAKQHKKLANAASAASTRQLADLRATVQELQRQQKDTGAIERAEEAVRSKLNGELAELRRKVADHVETIGKLAEVIDRTEGEKAAVALQLEEYKGQLGKVKEARKRADTGRKEAETRVAEARTEAASLKAALEAERARATAQKEKLEQEIAAAVARQAEEKATGPTSVRRSTEVQTTSFGTGTTTVAATQTDPPTEDNAPLSNAEIAKAAHRALNRLCEVAQLPRAVYSPSFHGHVMPPKAFRPPAQFDS